MSRVPKKITARGVVPPSDKRETTDAKVQEQGRDEACGQKSEQAEEGLLREVQEIGLALPAPIAQTRDVREGAPDCVTAGETAPLACDPWSVEQAVRIDAQALCRKAKKTGADGVPVVDVETLMAMGYSREISTVAIAEACDVKKPAGEIRGARVLLLSQGRDVGVERLDNGEKGYALCSNPARLRIGDVVRVRLASRWEVVL